MIRQKFKAAWFNALLLLIPNLIPCSLFITPVAVASSVPFIDQDFESRPNFALIRQIMTANCGRCHQNGNHRGGIQLDTEVEIERDAAVILTSIETGEMPISDRYWSQTREGKLVIQYLKSVLNG